MRGPPDPEVRSPAAANGRAKSQDLFHTEDSKSAALDLQARRLSRLYFLAHDISRTIAHLAYGVCR
jgi:hypothetical protein